MTEGVQPIAGVFVFDGNDACTGPEVTATGIMFNCTDNNMGGDVTVTIDTSKNIDPADADGTSLATLPATSFTITAEVLFNGFVDAASDEGSGSAVVLALASAGRWVLNGFQAFLPYMPYGSSISQVIYVVNRGTRFGDITVDWVDQNGNTGTLGVIGVLGAGTTLSLGPTILAALPAAQTNNGRLALTVTANVPAADVQINSQYNVSGNRAFVLHEDNRPD